MLKEKFMKMLAKKGKQLEPDEKTAKTDVMKELQHQAGDAMRGGFKKVSVASDSAEGLKKGLDKAKDIVAGKDPAIEKAEESMHEDLDHDNEEGESPEHKAKVLGPEGSESEEDSENPQEELLEDVQSPEECDMMIQKLMEKKKQLQYK